MRRNSIFWGLVIVLVGVVLLFNNLFPGLNVHIYLWPGLLILLGIWFLVGPALRRDKMEVETVSLPLAGIQSAELRFQHGAGRMTLSATSRPGVLLEGDFAGGLKVEQEQSGSAAKLRLRSKLWSDGVIFPGPYQEGGLVWNVGLSREIPLQLRFETGACEARIDLSDLLVSDVSLHTGASRTELTLPAKAGQTHLKVESGMAGVEIRVPEGVAARIKVSSGLAGINVSSRFPAVGGYYISPDYVSAANKVEVMIDTGMGSVEIK